jgi:hypothetical protein
MPSIGLHLTKCAGTSLVTDLRRRLTEDEYFLASSFWENLIAGRPNFWEIYNPRLLRFIFGHYIHESMVPQLAGADPWGFFLFTGVRKPLSRLVSQYGHLERITGAAVDLPAFVDQYGASMCDEILRAFPSLGSPNGRKWERALEILTCFDYAYSTEDYDNTIAPVYESLELIMPNKSEMAKDNIRVHEVDDGSKSALLQLVTNSDDFLLYATIEPYIGKKNFGGLLASGLNIARRRVDWFKNISEISSEVSSSDVLFNYHLDMMGYEMHLLGKQRLDDGIRHLDRKYLAYERQIKFLKQRIY